jgi:hypothetical protein
MFRRERREEDAGGGRRDGEDIGKVDVDGGGTAGAALAARRIARTVPNAE